MILVPRLGSLRMMKSIRVCALVLVARAAPRKVMPTMHMPASSSTHTKEPPKMLRFTTCMNTITLMRVRTTQQKTFRASLMKLSSFSI